MAEAVVLIGTQNIKTPNCYRSLCAFFFNQVIVLESTKQSHSTWAAFLFSISLYLSFIQSFTIETKTYSNDIVLSERICYQILDPYFTICTNWDPDFFPYKAFGPCMTCFDFWAMLYLLCRPEFARSSLICADIPSPGIFQEVTTYVDVWKIWFFGWYIIYG